MNRKKYTLLKRRVMVLLVLIPTLLIFGCARDLTPPVAIPVAPMKRESVIPQFTKISSGIDSTIDTNTKLQIKIKEQKQIITAQDESIKTVISLVNTEELIGSLKTIEARNLFIEQQNSELESIRVEQSDLLQAMRDDATDAYRKLLDKENEADMLRDQNKVISDGLVIKNNETETLKDLLAKEKVKSARANVYKNWVISLAVGYGLMILMKVILTIYKPF